MTMKTRMIPVVLASVALLALSGAKANQQTSTTTQKVTIVDCVVGLIQNVDVPAEVSGVLVEIPVKLGMQVEHGTLLAKINDSEAQIQLKVANLEHKVALKQANDTINIAFSKASYAVAKAEVHTANESNNLRKGAFSKSEMRRLYLTKEQSRLRIEKANFDLDVAKLTAEARIEQVEAAKMGIEHREIRASFDSQNPGIKGVVVEVFKQVNEWVQPGQPVMRIIRMDRLRVEGSLSGDEYNPEEVDGRPVIIEFKRARGEKVQLKGRVVFVNPEVILGNTYSVRAEVDNQKMENGHWLLSPGVFVNMTIELAPLPTISQAKRSVTK